MSVSEIIDKFIAENGGNMRDAITIALARLELARLVNATTPQRTPNATEALNEALRRLHLNIKGDIAFGRWEAIKIVTAYRQELTDACLDRISEGVDEWEEMQREADEIDASDADNYLDFLKQCRP